MIRFFLSILQKAEATAEKSKREYNQSEVERAAELETDFMVHLTHTDDHDKELLVKKKIPIVCCPRTNLILGDGFRNWMHLQGLESHGDLEAII